MKAETLIIRSDEKTKQDLKKLAESSKRTMSDYLRLLIEHAKKNNIKL